MITVKDLPSLLGNCTSADEWQARREEIKEILQREEYGYFPPIVDCHVSSKLVDHAEFAGKATVEELMFFLKNGEKEFYFPAKMIYPSNKDKDIPFFVFINFAPEIPHKYFYPEILMDKGVGILTFCHNDVSIDGSNFGKGLESLFIEGSSRDDTCFGKITLWAYAMQRGLDYLLTRPEADSKRIFAAGHSRLGKTALLAAAFDERFAGAHSNNSGCSGAAISRDKEGETIRTICTRFPYWFCKKYASYSDRENEMPFDQHFLLGLIAPRKISVAAALEDTWADSYNQYLACLGANSAYELLGERGIITEDAKQILGKEYIGGKVSYRERTGTHFFSYTDWLFAIDALIGE